MVKPALAQAMGDKDATLASGSAPIRAGLSHRDLLEHRRQTPGRRLWKPATSRPVDGRCGGVIISAVLCMAGE
jgi:hypothetical protein